MRPRRGSVLWWEIGENFISPKSPFFKKLIKSSLYLGSCDVSGWIWRFSEAFTWQQQQSDVYRVHGWRIPQNPFTFNIIWQTFFVRLRFMDSLLHYSVPCGASRETKKQIHGFLLHGAGNQTSNFIIHIKTGFVHKSIACECSGVSYIRYFQ